MCRCSLINIAVSCYDAAPTTRGIILQERGRRKPTEATSEEAPLHPLPKVPYCQICKSWLEG